MIIETKMLLAIIIYLKVRLGVLIYHTNQTSASIYNIAKLKSQEFSLSVICYY